MGRLANFSEKVSGTLPGPIDIGMRNVPDIVPAAASVKSGSSPKRGLFTHFGRHNLRFTQRASIGLRSRSRPPLGAGCTRMGDVLAGSYKRAHRMLAFGVPMAKGIFR